MNRFPSRVLPLLLCGVAAAAPLQEEGAPQPSPEVARFEPLIGTFEGKGTMRMEPGGEPAEWSATAVGTKILGGHAVQVDESIRTPMGPIHFRTLYAWDAERGRPVAHYVSNMGAGTTDLAWADADSLVGVEHGLSEGQAHAYRWIMDFGPEGYAFALDEAKGATPAYRHVEGRFRRVSKEPDAKAMEAAAGEPGAELKRLAPLLGSWTVEGKVVHGGQEIPITGEETVAWMFGGTVLAGHVEGQPGDYSADWYMAWDPEGRRYRTLHATSMGEVAMADTWLLEGGHLVTILAGTRGGEPGVERGVAVLANGAITRAWSDRIGGAGEPVRTFEATYARAGGAKRTGAGAGSDGSDAKAAAAPKFTPGSCCDRAAKAGKTCAHPCCAEAIAKGEVCARCNG